MPTLEDWGSENDGRSYAGMSVYDDVSVVNIVLIPFAELIFGFIHRLFFTDCSVKHCHGSG